MLLYNLYTNIRGKLLMVVMEGRAREKTRYWGERDVVTHTKRGRICDDPTLFFFQDITLNVKLDDAHFL